MSKKGKCRVGMSSDPQRRIADWMRAGYSQSTILQSGLTYSQALAAEREWAAELGCEAHGGGPKKLGAVYSIYKVW